MQIIDTAANTIDELKNYRSEYSLLQDTKSKLKDALAEFSKTKQDIDYYTFQTEQLQKANLSDNNELKFLEEQSSILENAEEIKSVLTNSIELIDNENMSIDSLLRELKNGLNRISGKYKHAIVICDRIESIIIELHDINDTLSSDIDRAEINPELLETVNHRIDLINSLLTKHNATNIEELKNKLNSYLNFIHGTEEIEESIKNLQLKTSQLEELCLKLAKKLNKNRQSIFPKTEKYIIEQLKQLGMPDANFKIDNEVCENISDNGVDNIKFLFSANKSINIQAIEKIASGGEFSRLMLTLKSLLVNASGISSIIFDEIDTGVSGEIANKMGKIMKKISSKSQVISITHLPQVAALGDYHFKVYKETLNEKTISNIRLLNKSQRINEIASMISGEKTTTEAIENAKILLSN
jgi:DNA repair protein RecN (Recombination protein N)